MADVKDEATAVKLPEISAGNCDNLGDNLSDTYRQALKFFKEHEGKSVILEYQVKLGMIAFSQQALHGPLDQADLPPLGTLDVIGRDRRNAWAKLGSMSKEEAMTSFVDMVSLRLPEFKAHLEAEKLQQAQKQKFDEEEKKRLKEEEKNREIAQEAERKSEEERQRQEEQRRQIQDALNKQTFAQFKSYAEQQYPDDPDRQAVLIRQLQEQHYRQYMQQVYQQQMESQATHTINLAVDERDGVKDIVNRLELITTNDAVTEPIDNEVEQEHECSDECGYCTDEDNVAPASMWTKKEIQDFKTSIRSEGGDSVITIGHGETVTIRVPTHEDGSALFWEFATDHYDVAFGLFFEWVDHDENEISVHISDSEDEDLDDDYNDGSDGDPETGSTAALLVDKGPPTSVVVPIYRRDCHEEVYAGTHPYPGRGVYLLKFDNSYSLWRSKTLYYRVYYTK